MKEKVYTALSLSLSLSTGTPGCWLAMESIKNETNSSGPPFLPPDPSWLLAGSPAGDDIWLPPQPNQPASQPGTVQEARLDFRLAQ